MDVSSINLLDLDQDLKSLGIDAGYENNYECNNLEHYDRDDLDNEIKIWSEFNYYYDFEKRLRGGDNDQTLSVNANSQCKIIVNAGYTVRESSKVLKAILEKDGAITFETTYDTFMKNTQLKQALMNSLILGLEHQPEHSKYGCNIVSDYDLCKNLQTDANFNQKMDLLHVSRTSDTYSRLKKNRTNIRRFINKLFEIVVLAFELPETPDPNDKSSLNSKAGRPKGSKNPPRPEISQEELAKSTSESVKLLGEQNVIRQINMDDGSSDLSLNERLKSAKISENPKADGSSSVWSSLAKKNPKNSQLYETPDSCLEVLTTYFSDALFNYQHKKVWDCCCGKNQKIVKFLTSSLDFTKACGSDLNFGEPKIDIFTCTDEYIIKNGIDLIITNTPWIGIAKYLERLDTLDIPFITLIPTWALQYNSVRRIMLKRTCKIIFAGFHKFTDENNVEKSFPFGQVWLVVADFHWNDKVPYSEFACLPPVPKDIEHDNDEIEMD
jgi:hypothetical protein